ncbi:hypothetical protein K504DRAFT_426245 [Pleomassaria siparia CBS 279.74]|uniref:EthD domain-containing protein n=1 Tax=Pleomassaria siparia CBS 279.74 TaxID=1314801 RepID=A0A6G1KIM5_9PLEO|nr:hypothetical protein K504DRAFT_426245 [Pleomassaria siparia CBS 279.74]
MPYTILIFLTRHPSLTSEEFRNHWENVYIPLNKSLTGHLFPLLFKRHYFARIDRAGFGGAANRDRPALLLRGSVDDFDYDSMGEMTFDSEAAFREYYRVLYEPKAAALLAREEKYFLDTQKVIIVVVGDSTGSR